MSGNRVGVVYPINQLDIHWIRDTSDPKISNPEKLKAVNSSLEVNLSIDEGVSKAVETSIGVAGRETGFILNLSLFYFLAKVILVPSFVRRVESDNKRQ